MHITLFVKKNLLVILLGATVSSLHACKSEKLLEIAFDRSDNRAKMHTFRLVQLVCDD